MHKLLQRQLRQSRRDGAEELDLDQFLALVDAAYEEADRERRINSHAYQVVRTEHETLLDRQLKTHAVMAQIRAEKAEAERARAVAEAELLKKERLSVLGQLTATVAHELRNPLSAIRNSMETVRALAGAEAARIERPMTRIERSIARCDGIIADLTDYARARELNRAEVPLDHWLGDVLDEQKIAPGVALERRLAAPDARIAIDADRFRRVVINLVENAVQAIVEAGAAIEERRIRVATSCAETIDIVIADTGPGMTPEVLARVFEPLYSTKPFGTGLGLPTVKQIVEQHGGTIRLSSAPGEGTMVAISLPAGAASAREDAVAAQ